MKTREEEKERATLSIISSIMQYKTERGGGGFLVILSTIVMDIRWTVVGIFITSFACLQHNLVVLK